MCGEIFNDHSIATLTRSISVKKLETGQHLMQLAQKFRDLLLICQLCNVRVVFISDCSYLSSCFVIAFALLFKFVKENNAIKHLQIK